MKKEKVYLFYLNIIIVLFALSLTNCGGNEQQGNKRLSSPSDYMTNDELLILQHAVTYAKGDIDRISNKEAIPLLEDFFTPDEEKGIDCDYLHAEDIIELFSSQNRSQFLREKGFHLYDIATNPSRTIYEAKQVNSEDVLSWGKCRFAKEEQYVGGKAGVLHFLAEGLDYGDYFKTNIRTQNVLNSTIDIFPYDKNLDEIKNKGIRLKVEKYGIHSLPSGETYEYNGFYWRRLNMVGSGESILSVIKKDMGHELGIFSCSFFEENKLAELLNWEESNIEYVPVQSGDKRVRICQFNNTNENNYFSFGVNDKFLKGQGHEPKDLKATYDDLVEKGEYRFLSKKKNSSMIISKKENQFGFNKWNYTINYQIDNKREFLMSTLSETKENRKLEKLMVELIEKFASEN